MKTIILPGYSLHNKDWAEEMAGTVHYWRHWKTGGSFSLRYELEKILTEIGKNKVNIIAKSVGTGVLMHLLPKIKNQVEKIILCGIPTVSDENKRLFTTSLSAFPVENVVCFQNTKDPFATFKEVDKFMREVNKKIRVIEKPRSDHNYPYFEDFEKFLR